MKKTLFIIVLFLAHSAITQAQNTPVKCIKTIWPLNDSSYQIDSYNIHKQKLQSIMVNAMGDTTQWFVNVYNNDGVKVKRYSVKDNYSESYAITFQYDSLGELFSTTRKTAKELRIDTIPEIEKKKNIYGYPIYLAHIGFLEFKFDNDSNILYQKITAKDSSEVTEYYYEYNSKGRRISEKHFINDKLNSYSKSYFKGKSQLIKTENYDSLNRLKYTEYYEYSSANFNSRTFAISENEEGFLWEMVFKKIECIQHE